MRTHLLPEAGNTVSTNYAKTLKLICTAGSGGMQDPSPVLPFQRRILFWAPTWVSLPADCQVSLLQFIIQIKRSSSGSKKWLIRSPPCSLVWNSNWFEGSFLQIDTFQQKQSVLRNQFFFFFSNKPTLHRIWVVCQRFAESSLCHTFSLLISKSFIKNRVGNQCSVIRNVLV